MSDGQVQTGGGVAPTGNGAGNPQGGPALGSGNAPVNSGNGQSSIPPTGTANTGGPEWYATFNDDTKGYVQSKGFKDPGAVVESYRNLEKLMGAPSERIIKLPEKFDDPNVMGPIYDKLGRPQKPEEYGLVTPKEGGDAEFTSAAAKAFYEQGLSRQQATKLTEWWNGLVASRVQAISTAKENAFNQESTKLKAEWGAAHEQNVDIGKKAAATFGITKEQIDGIEKVLGFAGTMKLFHNIGSKLGEHSYVDGNGGSQMGGKLTPEQAKYKLGQLSKDTDWVRRYTNGDTAAREEMEKLQKFMNPGE